MKKDYVRSVREEVAAHTSRAKLPLNTTIQFTTNKGRRSRQDWWYHMMQYLSNDEITTTSTTEGRCARQRDGVHKLGNINDTEDELDNKHFQALKNISQVTTTEHQNAFNLHSGNSDRTDSLSIICQPPFYKPTVLTVNHLTNDSLSEETTVPVQ
ncbi:hypothetical protein WUBG_06687 [Wuchereria bancrofti]|uniref:Uncharacterized protein n=1 Tax=Wuchereria bancrofti TaxID=6293 RepID=J9EYX6_WUCBA|nr:hypothetical protein WUBG_06687 [Wuchereria bancrofti]VDM23238.1 unnamed protein product [Wuchereria bancrofti]